MKPLDLAVIGGGITGLGVARLAARNGFSVAVIERGDLAGATSSVSSHMLHGGLRYLEHFQFGLVRESLAQRAEVLRMAGSLATPRRFLVPMWKESRVQPWRLGAGLTLYDWLAGRRGLSRHTMNGPRETLALEPGLEPVGLRGSGLYSDVVMDDGRLAIAVARDAAERGAAIHTWTEVTGAHPGDGEGPELDLRDALTGATLTIAARVIVNATGPWTDATRRLLRRGLEPGTIDPPPLLKPSRGIHLVFPSLAGHGLLVFAAHDGRAVFGVPLERHTLWGTTEIEVDSPPTPEQLLPSVEEIRYLRGELQRVLPAAGRAAALAVIAGVRPLRRSDAAVGDASREHLVVADGPLISVSGGKWTTFRVMAADVLRAVIARLGVRRAIVDPVDPLPPPIAAGAPLEAVAAHAVEQEFARRLPDVLRRRTALWLEPDRGRVAAPRVAAVMEERLGWNPERTREEIRQYESALREEEDLLQRATEG